MGHREDQEKHRKDRFLREAKERLARMIDAFPWELHHYTDIQGLQGIIEKKKIWATNAMFLNDSMEGKLYEKAYSLVYENAKKNAPTKEEEAFLKELPAATSLLNHGAFYVTCFSQRPNDLSQWRAYGGHSLPIQLTFSTRHLMPTTDDSSLVRCEYDERKQRTHVEDAFNPMISAVRGWPGTRSGWSEQDQLDQYAQFVRWLRPMFKDASFHGEAEWRLVHSYTYHDEKAQVEFRSRRSMLVPYIPQPINLQEGLTSVLVGPTPHPEENNSAVRLLLAKSGFPHVKVDVTEIPFRYW
jgi:hypothetical protein